MSIIAWIILGLVAGFIASRIVNGAGEGVAFDMVLGIVGAVAGDFLFHFGRKGGRDRLESLEHLRGCGGRRGGVGCQTRSHPSRPSRLGDGPGKTGPLGVIGG